MKELERLKKIVADARILRGWGQRELADKSDVGLSTIQKIEQGRPPLPERLTLQKIANGLGVSYDSFFGWLVFPAQTGNHRKAPIDDLIDQLRHEQKKNPRALIGGADFARIARDAARRKEKQ